MNSSTSSRNDGGPAFPADSFTAQHCPGMSLRDWFAGQALAGILARCNGPDFANVEHLAYEIADAMLRQRLE